MLQVGRLLTGAGHSAKISSFLVSARLGQRRCTTPTLLLCLQATARAPFTSRAWHEFPWARACMLEPWLKISLTLIGITFELWSGEPYFEMRCVSSGHDTVLDASSKGGLQSSYLTHLAMHYSVVHAAPCAWGAGDPQGNLMQFTCVAAH